MNASKTLNVSLTKDQGKTKIVKSRLGEKLKKTGMTIEEEIMEREIQAVEKQRLTHVFNLLCGEANGERKFGVKHLIAVLERLDYNWTKQEVEQMVWEVDEDLDQSVSQYEFELMYKRCVKDETGLEPRNLFNLVQFLMYEKSKVSRITVEDTLELLYVRYGRELLDMEIEAIFGKDEKTSDGQEKEVTYTEYLSKMKKRDFDRRLTFEKARKTVKPIPEEQKQ